MHQLIQFSNKIRLLIVCLILISCKKENKVDILKQNIILKEFYNNGKPKRIIYNLKNDTIFEKNFSFDSKLVSEGKIFKQKLCGKWNFYNKEEKIDKQIEYINVCGTQYVNQGWFFDKRGDTIKNRSNYFNLTLKKNELMVNEKIKIKFFYNRILYDNSILMLSLSPDIDDNFCNVKNSKNLICFSKSDTLFAKIGFSTRGKKCIRGFIKEFFNKKSDLIDSITTGERFVYFKIDFEVY